MKQHDNKGASDEARTGELPRKKRSRSRSRKKKPESSESPTVSAEARGAEPPVVRDTPPIKALKESVSLKEKSGEQATNEKSGTFTKMIDEAKPLVIPRSVIFHQPAKTPRPKEGERSKPAKKDNKPSTPPDDLPEVAITVPKRTTPPTLDERPEHEITLRHDK